MVMVRSGSDWSFYVDGTRTYNASLGSSTISAGGTNILLGKSWSTTSQMEGYWDDFRITVGLARYSGVSFTVPTTAHLTSAGDVNKHIVVNSDADGVAIGTGGINQARIAKAWADIDGTQAAASMIASSYNISSITDHGTGTYSFNFSTAMADADYSFSAGLGHIPSATAIGVVLAQEKTTALIKVRSRYESSGGNDYDYNTICIQVFGN
tara:strand:- start:347 stop:976 length:630 start_codon:yes stop_codon:yes gene_type:complete